MPHHGTPPPYRTVIRQRLSVKIKECAKGTFDTAEAIAANSKAKSIIGGGASLEFPGGKELPGVAAIVDK